MYIWGRQQKIEDMMDTTKPFKWCEKQKEALKLHSDKYSYSYISNALGVPYNVVEQMLSGV